MHPGGINNIRLQKKRARPQRAPQLVNVRLLGQKTTVIVEVLVSVLLGMISPTRL